MVNLLIIRGPCGSGKSTVGKILRGKLQGKTALLCPDIFYWDICGKDDDSELVYEALYRLIDLYLAKGYNVILEGMLSRKDDKGNLAIKRFIGLGNQYGARTSRFFLNASLRTTIKRDNQRGNLLGSEENTKKLHEQSLKSKHEEDIEIDTEDQEPALIAEKILAHL